MLWLRPLEPILRPLFHIYARLTNGKTIGVRGLALDEEGRVLLIEHTYTKGWYMPGGGIERGEDAETALKREMLEEAGVEVIGRPALVGVYDNRRAFPEDHVLLYRVDHWRAVEPTQKGEILARGFFHPDDLPPDTTPGTRKRIREALERIETDVAW
jgi:8-oxo-dGTP pyrophosphatase MutT (NUDIX family)